MSEPGRPSRPAAPPGPSASPRPTTSPQRTVSPRPAGPPESVGPPRPLASPRVAPASHDGEAPAIEVVAVTKEFDAGRIRALDDISLTVGRGEFVAVTGPSGCGKSTLLHLIAALDTPTSGEILIAGRSLRGRRHLDAYRRHEVGLVFQLHNLLPHLTTLQNVEVAMLGTGLHHREQRARALARLDEVGLAGRADARPPLLSGGERQRVAIARALANDPPLVLADEPTGNLDSDAVGRVLDLLRQLRAERGTTIVMVTHDPQVAAAADRTLRMRDGGLDTAASARR